jgi:hypothetical protein
MPSFCKVDSSPGRRPVPKPLPPEYLPLALLVHVLQSGESPTGPEEGRRPFQRSRECLAERSEAFIQVER